jgi:Domain of unknown function (DUF222)
MGQRGDEQPSASGAADGTFAGVAEAMAAVEAGLRFLARADAASLPVDTLADCLRAFSRTESVHTAARSRFLSAFTAQAGCEADGHGTAKSWLRWQAQLTSGAAGAQVRWMRCLTVHPRVAAALSSGQVSPSWARQLCDWTDLLPSDVRDDADQILLSAAAGGANLSQLAELAAAMYERTAPPDSDDGNGPGGDEDGFKDRRLWLDLHFRGAGKLSGDLTPDCAAALTVIMESLGKKAGPEDHRTEAQRAHDALEEACRRLIAAGGLPDRAGQPTQIQLHMTLDQLMSLNGGSGTDGSGPDSAPGGLPGPVAGPGAPCDATIVPVVSGRVDPVVLDQLAAQLLKRGAAGIQRHAGTTGYQPGADVIDPADQTRPVRTAPDARRTARDLILADAVRLLSGPGGLAATLRAGASYPPAAAASLPLDVGKATDTIPPHLRRAVIVRDRTCRFPGCQQPAAACDIHHVIWRARGGRTQLVNLVLLCRFHHLIAIHRWGWTITLHPDATVTAVSPDGRRNLHSHGPPGVAAA